MDDQLLTDIKEYEINRTKKNAKKLFTKAYKRFEYVGYSYSIPYCDMEDMISEAIISLFKLANSGAFYEKIVNYNPHKKGSEEYIVYQEKVIPETRLDHYLAKILLNKVRDDFRKRKTQEKAIFAYLVQKISFNNDPLDEAGRREFYKILPSILAELSKKEKKVLYEYYVMGHSDEKIKNHYSKCFSNRMAVCRVRSEALSKLKSRLKKYEILLEN